MVLILKMVFFSYRKSRKIEHEEKQTRSTVRELIYRQTVTTFKHNYTIITFGFFCISFSEK